MRDAFNQNHLELARDDESAEGSGGSCEISKERLSACPGSADHSAAASSGVVANTSVGRDFIKNKCSDYDLSKVRNRTKGNERNMSPQAFVVQSVDHHIDNRTPAV